MKEEKNLQFPLQLNGGVNPRKKPKTKTIADYIKTVARLSKEVCRILCRMLKTNLKKPEHVEIRGSQRLFRENKISIYKGQFEKITPCQKN